MKLIYYFAFILAFTTCTSLPQEVTNFENMLRQALFEYNVSSSTIKENHIKFSVEMQDDVKEHLANVEVGMMNKNN